MIAADVADWAACAAAADGIRRAEFRLRIAGRLLARAVATVGRVAFAVVTARPAIECIVLEVHAAAATAVPSGRTRDRTDAHSAGAGCSACSARARRTGSARSGTAAASGPCDAGAPAGFAAATENDGDQDHGARRDPGRAYGRRDDRTTAGGVHVRPRSPFRSLLRLARDVRCRAEHPVPVAGTRGSHRRPTDLRASSSHTPPQTTPRRQTSWNRIPRRSCSIPRASAEREIRGHGTSGLVDRGVRYPALPQITEVGRPRAAQPCLAPFVHARVARGPRSCSNARRRLLSALPDVPRRQYPRLTSKRDRDFRGPLHAAGGSHA